MVLYARNDIKSHSSNGHVHVRPVKPDGTPVPIWGISCPQCERQLASHPAWSASRYRIPLTPDEAQEASDAKAAAEAALHQQQMLLAQQAITAQMAAKGAEPVTDPADIAVTGNDSLPATDVVAASPSPSASDYAAMNKADLKDLARDRGLPVSGTLADLVARHVDYDKGGTG